MERWLIGILLALLTANVGFLNYIVISEIKKPVCVFDVQRFIEHFSSQDIDKQEADVLLEKTKNFLESLNCKAVFVRGALITGQAKDVTEEVIGVVKNLHFKAGK